MNITTETEEIATEVANLLFKTAGMPTLIGYDPRPHVALDAVATMGIEKALRKYALMCRQNIRTGSGMIFSNGVTFRTLYNCAKRIAN